MSEYTAQDFANAQFAELGKYGLRAHKSAGDSYWQRDGIKRATNEEMADGGWAPVPTKPAITESELIAAVDETNHEDMNEYQKAYALLVHLGYTIPTPEPTNAEKLQRLQREWVAAHPVSGGMGLIEYLDMRGVRAPGGDEPDAEHDRAWWVENANVNDAEDCEACVGDLCPVHHGIALGIEFVTKKITALGDDPELFNSIPTPPKAPGGDDDH